MPLLLVLLMLIFSSIGSGTSGLMVDWEVDREPKGFLRGPKWVSLNSARVSNEWSVRVELHALC